MLKYNLYVIFITVILSSISYLYIDKMLVYALYQIPNLQHPVTHELTQMPELFSIGAIFYYLYYVVRFYISKPRAIEKNLLTATTALVIGVMFKNILKFVFSRTWPLPWLGDNPSLISTHSYGFFWFHGGSAYEAFPSGHMTVTACVMSVLWLCYPKLWWLWTLIATIVLVILVAMNFHFLSDVIAGAGLGMLIGYWTYTISLSNRQY